MSDFSITARCPGCGQRFAPDDGDCCVPCKYCEEYDRPWKRHRYCDEAEDYVCEYCWLGEQHYEDLERPENEVCQYCGEESPGGDHPCAICVKG